MPKDPIACFDVRCDRCGSSVGWCGVLSNPPPCPKCGFISYMSEGDAKELREFADLLRKRKEEKNGR